MSISIISSKRKPIRKKISLMRDQEDLYQWNPNFTKIIGVDDLPFAVIHDKSYPMNGCGKVHGLYIGYNSDTNAHRFIISNETNHYIRQVTISDVLSEEIQFFKILNDRKQIKPTEMIKQRQIWNVSELIHGHAYCLVKDGEEYHALLSHICPNYLEFTMINPDPRKRRSYMTIVIDSEFTHTEYEVYPML